MVVFGASSASTEDYHLTRIAQERRDHKSCVKDHRSYAERRVCVCAMCRVAWNTRSLYLTLRSSLVGTTSTLFSFLSLRRHGRTNAQSSTGIRRVVRGLQCPAVSRSRLHSRKSARTAAETAGIGGCQLLCLCKFKRVTIVECRVSPTITRC